MRPWQLGFDPHSKSLWVQLLSITKYKDAKALNAIRNSVGRLISIVPEMTKLSELSYARIYVEVNMQMDLHLAMQRKLMD